MAREIVELIKCDLCKRQMEAGDTVSEPFTWGGRDYLLEVDKNCSRAMYAGDVSFAQVLESAIPQGKKKKKTDSHPTRSKAVQEKYKRFYNATTGMFECPVCRKADLETPGGLAVHLSKGHDKRIEPDGSVVDAEHFSGETRAVEPKPEPKAKPKRKPVKKSA